MSITSFSKPSDADVLQKIVDKSRVICFVGEGIISQNEIETNYIRTLKANINATEVILKVVYKKRGVSWLFDNIEINSNPNIEK